VLANQKIVDFYINSTVLPEGKSPWQATKDDIRILVDV
jgi:hypothetical protein